MDDTLPVRCLYVTGLKANTVQHTHLKNILMRFFQSNVGPVESIRINGKNKSHTFAFVTMQNYEDAQKALKQMNYSVKDLHYSAKIFVRPADSWHQPKPPQLPCKYVYDPSKPSLDDLNDDCFLHIFQFLNIYELTQLRGISGRWDDLLLMVAKSKFSTFDFAFLPSKPVLTVTRAQAILEYIGPIVKELALDGDIFHHNKLKVLEAVREHCDALESLELDGYNMDAKSSEILLSTFKKLKKFETTGTTRFDDQIGMCFKEAENLREIIIDSNEYFYGHSLSELQNLETLELNNCSNINSEALVRALKKSKSTLRTLNIQRCVKLQDEVVDIVVNECKALETLLISNQYPGITKLADLGKCESLKKLIVEFHNLVSIDPLLEIVSERNQIEQLNYTGAAALRGKTMEYVSNMTNLKNLHMAYNSVLKDEDIVPLKSLTQLEQLSIFGASMVSGDAIFQVVTQCPNLSFLDVSKTLVDNAFVKKVIDMQIKAPQRPKLLLVVYSTKVDKFITEEESIKKEIKDRLTLDFTKHQLSAAELYGDDFFGDDDDEDFSNDDGDFFDSDDDYDFDVANSKLFLFLCFFDKNLRVFFHKKFTEPLSKI